MLTGAAGGAIYYAKKRREKSIRSRALKLGNSAASFLDKSLAEVERQKKGVVEAIGAGKAAYQRVAG